MLLLQTIMSKKILALALLCFLQSLHCALIPTEPNVVTVHEGHDHGAHGDDDHGDHNAHDEHDHGPPEDDGHDHGDDDDESHDGHDEHDHEVHEDDGHDDDDSHEDHDDHDHDDHDHGGHEDDGHDDDDSHEDHDEHGHDQHEDHESDDEDDTHDGHDHDDHEGHDHHGHDGDPFRELLDNLGATKMDLSTVSSLAEELNEKVRCGDSGCSKCITGVQIFQSANIQEDTVLDKAGFEETANVLIYYLMRGMGIACNDTSGLVGIEDAKTQLFTGESVCHERFENIVSVIAANSCSRVSECFEAHDTVFGNGVECMTKREASEQSLLTHLLAAVFECKCNLPEAEYFMGSLMETYGTSSGVMTSKGFQNLLSHLEIGNEKGVSEETGHEGHDHRKKRETAEHDDEDHLHECYASNELLTIFDFDESRGIDATQLTILCPALIQQVVTDACKVTQATTNTIDEDYMDKHRYGYGTASVFIISMLAFLGLLVFPAIGTSGYKLTMQFFIALGVGTMSGDAILHIIPEVVGLHQHGAGDAHDHEEEDRTYMWRLLVVIGGIYVFYLFENVVRLWNRLQNGNIAIHLHQHGSGDHDHRPENLNDRSHTHQLSELSASTGLEGEEKTSSGDNKEKKVGGMTTVAIMVLIGDILHNFGDGIAIGVSFSSSWITGVATSIAVFCHELPHEFGDFAIYTSNGMSKWKALAANFGAACAAFIGLYLGIGVATDAEIRHWILAVIAGMFIYISLVDVLHEMLEEKTDRPLLQFALQNLGLVLGWAILLVIALYEESISSSIRGDSAH